MESADDEMKPDEGLLAAVLACHLALLRVVPRDLRSGTTGCPGNLFDCSALYLCTTH